MREPAQVHDVDEQVGLHNDLIFGSKARQHRHRWRGCLKHPGLPGGAVTARVVSGDCFVRRLGDARTGRVDWLASVDQQVPVRPRRPIADKPGAAE
jgi:hypothetical protein